MTRPVVTLVCSNDTHVDTFAPVVDELAARGLASHLVALDRWYRQGATARAAVRGIPITEMSPDAVESVDSRRFYARPTVAIWRDVIRARRPIRSHLEAIRPAAVVLGNDFGLLEKLVIDEARRHRVPTVLVQDGTLASGRPRPTDARLRARRLIRRTASPVLRLARVGFLASSDYGAGGVDAVCASGPAGARILERAGGGRSRVIVTGQPRYDRLPVNGGVGGGGVAWFTTPFEAQNLGGDAQRRQRALIDEVAASLRALSVPLTLKLHPRERATEYGGVVAAIATGVPSDTLVTADVAVVGISTVLDEAAILGVPVIVPGTRLHRGGLGSLLPPSEAYPRFDSGEAASRLVATLRDATVRGETVKRQQAVVRERLAFGGADTAARRVAAVIARLATRSQGVMRDDQEPDGG
jgi:hypothetical protein